jgi:hypothetical protein
MARTTNPDKDAILTELAAARSRLSETGGALRTTFDLASRAKQSFQRHRPTWLGGAALLGLVLAKLPTRRKTVFVEKATGKTIGAAGKLGFLWPVAKLVFDFAMPVVSELAGKYYGVLRGKFGLAGDERSQAGQSSRP